MTPWIRGFARALFLITLASVPLCALAYENHPDHEKEPKDLDEKVRAVNFVPFGQLAVDQQRLLQTYFQFIEAIPYPATSVELTAVYQNWCMQRDWFAAEFLAITHVMAQTHLDVEGKDTLLISMVKEVRELKGDRIYAVLDDTLFHKWMKGSQGYTFDLPGGKRETGSFHMGGTQYGGSLHTGFDIQGFTSTTKVPRLQINYKNDGSLADVDLDAYKPFVGGMIPNPHHLSYQNSDSRYWLSSYVKKFGSPGFEISKTH